MVKFVRMKRVLKKEHAKDAGKLLAGIISGFSFFLLTSHPEKSPVRKLPEKRIKNVSYFPNVKAHGKTEYYHFHHWMIFSFLYPLVFVKKKLRQSKFLHGLMIGSIVQGLTYKDRFQIRHNPSK